MSNSGSNKENLFSLVVLTTLFFMWGFLTSMNDILIPYLRETFDLKIWQGMLVQFCFFGAYFIGSLIYFLISLVSGDPINRIGYKNGIVLGLGLAAIGTFLFWPAATLLSYPLFLGALFTIGLGLTLLQISANPYVTILGSEETASSRLNLSQGFNSFGTTLAPMLGGYLIFRLFGDVEPGKADAVIVPYLTMSGVFVLLLLFFLFIKLPEFKNATEIQSGFGALKYPHVLFGMLAIFFYVGSEVSVGSFLINYFEAPEMGGFTEEKGSTLVAFYWGGLMIGRFMGAISLSKLKQGPKILGMLGLAVVCFLVIWVSAVIKDNTFSMGAIWMYIVFIAVNFGAFLIGKALPHRTILIFALVSVALLVTTMVTDGQVALWSIIGVGLFNSIIWSNIFSLSLERIGPLKSQASSLLVMMILGGALLPVIQGFFADSFTEIFGADHPVVHAEYLGIKYSFFIPLLGYLYLAFYGWKGHSIRKPEVIESS